MIWENENIFQFDISKSGPADSDEGPLIAKTRGPTGT